MAFELWCIWILLEEAHKCNGCNGCNGYNDSSAQPSHVVLHWLQMFKVLGTILKHKVYPYLGSHLSVKENVDDEVRLCLKSSNMGFVDWGTDWRARPQTWCKTHGLNGCGDPTPPVCYWDMDCQQLTLQGTGNIPLVLSPQNPRWKDKWINVSILYHVNNPNYIQTALKRRPYYS